MLIQDTYYWIFNVWNFEKNVDQNRLDEFDECVNNNQENNIHFPKKTQNNLKKISFTSTTFKRQLLLICLKNAIDY